MEDAIIAFLQKYLTCLHVSNKIFYKPFSEFYEFDSGLRSTLYDDVDYLALFQKIIQEHHEKKLYFLRDFSEVYYVLFWISDDAILWIGPYALSGFDRSRIGRLLQQLNIPLYHQKYFFDYHNLLPVLAAPEHFDTMLISAAEQLCRTESLSYEYSPLPLSTALSSQSYFASEQSFIEDLQTIELRYEYMHQILDAVKVTNMEKALQALTQFLSLKGPTRFSNTIKDKSYYLSIFNVSLRNTAWDSHVHPYYLDKLSKKFSYHIDRISSDTDKEGLMRGMVRQYCNLIRNHAEGHGSTFVQRVSIFIDYDLSADLSLRAIAGQLGINASYLSSLFRKETGMTLTEYVNRRRIEKAVYFLNSSDMQIQTIGQLVGIYDLAYFTKLFKKQIGMSPSQYRKSLH